MEQFNGVVRPFGDGFALYAKAIRGNHSAIGEESLQTRNGARLTQVEQRVNGGGAQQRSRIRKGTVDHIESKIADTSETSLGKCLEEDAVARDLVLIVEQ